MGLKSILSYPGGKQRIADKLIEKRPDRVENWYEPFFGGGSVTLNYLQSYKSLATKHIIVADKYEPFMIARFAVSVAQHFNKFYHDCQINVEEENVKLARLKVVDVTMKVIKSALDLLGIECPEQM